MGIWFLVITLCTVGPAGVSDTCDDYIVDRGMSYSDCTAAVNAAPYKADMFAIACQKGEVTQ